jgi:hypothetical protein
MLKILNYFILKVIEKLLTLKNLVPDKKLRVYKVNFIFSF